MLKEKKKSESTLRSGKASKLPPTQKVSLCLTSGNHSILKPKRHSFRYNLNIKFKTTKSSPEKTISNNNNNQDEGSSQKVSNKNTTNVEQQQVTTGSNAQKDFDAHKMPSDEYLKSKLIKKQTKMSKLNFTNPKYIINNKQHISTSISCHNNRNSINNNNKVFKQRLLSPIASNNHSNSNNNNMNIHKQTNSHNSLNELFIINNTSKQLHTPNSQTMPGSIHTSRKQSKDKKLIIQHHLHSMRINNNHNNITAPSMQHQQQQQHNTLLIGCSKRSFNKNLLLQPRKNRILTNITRNCDKKRKVNATRSDNNNNNNNMNLLTSNQSIKSNVSSNSQDKIVSIRRNAKNNNLNLKSILLCSNTINNSNSNNTKAHHLTSENSPTKKKLSSFHNKRCDNNNSLIKKDKCNKTTYAKLNNNINIHNHIIHNDDNDSDNINKHIIYSLKTSRIGVANMKIHTEGGLLLRNSQKGHCYRTNNNNNNSTHHSKSTSHSKHKKTIAHKINNDNKHKDSGNSSSNNTSKKISIPPQCINTNTKSKTTKPQHTIINQHAICTNNNNNHQQQQQQPFITEHSFSFNNNNNNNTSISSMKSQLIKEGTYYSLESDRLSSYIKSYYTKHNVYPKTKLPFYKFGRLIGRGAFGKVNLGLHILSGRIVAIKSFNKSKLETTSKARDKIYHEVNIMRNLKHNLIIRIFETIETPQYILIIMENISGGDLLSFVKKRTKLSEKTAKFIFRQLITALKHIHAHNIVHRDIKLDNILIDLNNNIKLCDFGVSKQIHKGMLLKDKCGTPAYIAPEILSNDNGYEGPPVDMWSSGVVLYAMLSGTVPFKPANLKELNKIMMKGEYPPIQDISKEATHLISGLLELDPKRRFTIDKVMNHPWLVSEKNEDWNKFMLFTKAEMVLLSKANVDYTKAHKSEMMEHFTIKNLDTNNDKCNKNVSSKSFIFAPFNSTFTSVSDGDNDECEISIEKNVIKFNNETQALNRIYELNYNGEIDHGVLIQHRSHNNNTQHVNGVVSLSINDNNNNNSLISGECYDEIESPLSHEYDCNTQTDTQRNVTSLTTTSTQHIDENALTVCERLGYSKQYMQYVLLENELNYATATYYLLCNPTASTVSDSSSY